MGSTLEKLKIKERKLFETTQYLITICRRLTSDLPYGIEKECYFIGEDVKDALKNIGTKQARFFAKEIEKAKLQEKFRPQQPEADKMQEALKEIEKTKSFIKKYDKIDVCGCYESLNRIKYLLQPEADKVEEALKKLEEISQMLNDKFNINSEHSVSIDTMFYEISAVYQILQPAQKDGE